MKVLAALLEEDRVALCGPRHQPDAKRQAYRHGHDQGRLVLGGRKVSVRKPRVRDVEGQEVTLPSWHQLSAEDPLRRRVVEQILVGVSTRKYERSLEDLPPGVEPSCAKKSSVSRRFVAKSAEQVRAFLARPLEELDLPVLMIDGTHLGDFLLLVALGIDREGHKHVLGIWEGSTESAEVCRSLLRQLLGQGLRVERSRLVVIDGSKGLRKAVHQVFHRWAVVQRCQFHKIRNVLEHLPESRRPWAKAVLRRAFRAPTAKQGQREVRQLIQQIQEDHPGAAASLEEGLSELFTLNDLGITEGALWRSLRSTNAIENLQGTLQ